MIVNMLKRVYIIIAIILFALLILPVAGCMGETKDPGILQGRVTIGPIWPVERPGEKMVILREIYEVRKVMVYDKGGKKLIKEVSLSSQGHYSVQLNPGIYIVDINRTGIYSSSEVPKQPKQIVIEPGQTVVLDIDIDTGIR